MTEEAELLRKAIEASIEASRLDPRGEHFTEGEPYCRHAEAIEAANKAWKAYDMCIWSDRYAE